jgi:hypothetical protein
MALKVSGRKLQALRDAKTRNTSITWKELLLSDVIDGVDAFGGRVFPGARFFENENAVGEEGRFTSEDPARDGLNWYVYCSNNPLAFVDPTGLLGVLISRGALPGDKLPVIQQVNTGSRFLDEALAGLSSVYNTAAIGVNMPFVAAAAGEQAYNATTEAVLGQKGFSGEGLSKDIELFTLFCMQNPQAAAAAAESLKFITSNLPSQVSAFLKSKTGAAEK